jgi:hypothetical protein
MEAKTAMTVLGTALIAGVKLIYHRTALRNLKIYLSQPGAGIILKKPIPGKLPTAGSKPVFRYPHRYAGGLGIQGPYNTNDKQEKDDTFHTLPLIWFIRAKGFSNRLNTAGNPWCSRL